MPYRCRLGIEPLEDRRLLSITVNTLVDENNGIGVGGISLREAIAAAPSGDIVDFSVTGTINLSSLGQISISKSLTIKPDTKEKFDDSVAAETWASEGASDVDDLHMDSVEQVFSLLASN
jgi:hypothetical protein